MFILNTTIALDHAIEAEVIDWLRFEFMPSAAKHGFTDAKLSRVITEEVEDTDSVSLALQMHASDIGLIEKWHNSRGRELLTIMSLRWPQRALPFITHLEIIE